MIAQIYSPVSSVVALAERACMAEGVSLAHFRNEGRYRGAAWTATKQRIIWRLRRSGPITPSFPEMARALGMPNHSSVITAYRREERARNMGN